MSTIYYNAQPPPKSLLPEPESEPEPDLQKVYGLAIAELG
jgi:hypothetical protein